jgi:thiamine-phosphate pyrophosphorylase
MEGLYAIVDVPHPFGLDPEAMTRAVLAERLRGGRDGAAVVQLRAKAASTDERIELLERMAPICAAADVPLVVDDDVDAALAVGCGVHLGQHDPGAGDLAGLRLRARERRGEQLLVGLSTHDLPQLRAAEMQAPAYVAYGPVLPTRSKAKPDAVVGLAGLLDACRTAARPLVAIGGLDAVSGVRAVELGASAVAVIGALVAPTADETAARARDLARAWIDAAAALDLDAVAQRIPVVPRQLIDDLTLWSDDLGLCMDLGLPARFRPRMIGGRAQWRPCDVIDLLHALDKRDDESWDEWRARSPDAVRLVALRIR